MKKAALLILCVFILKVSSHSQITTNSQWTWMKGDNTINQPGVYGAQGIASPSNKPGSRRASVSWKDASGNLWLFGGVTQTGNIFNDLWKYNSLTNEWTWVKGDNTPNQYSVYGVQATPASTNKPGSRWGSVSWTDASGNFWLFGGYGYDVSNVLLLNDLWKYNPSSNQWTWMKGDTIITSSFPIYGSQGFPSQFNKPGGRYGSNSWIDASGNLWVFGGYGHQGVNNFGRLNDLWKYNPSTNQWAWMKGDNINSNQQGVYGTQGVAATNNKPGSREGASSWMDGSGNLFLFGGFGYAASSTNGYLNDLWKYDPVLNQWTWVHGSSGWDQKGTYGIIGVAGPANTPGGREGAISWKDAVGNCWLLGGVGYASNSIGGLNDLWKYNVSINQWTWIKGDDVPNINSDYGIQGITANTNKPGKRDESVGWVDNSGNFWMFGGRTEPSTGGCSNELWKLNTTYTFTGNGSWQTPSNWSNNNIPPNPITNGIEVIIDHTNGGQCVNTGQLDIHSGGKITVNGGKTLTIQGGLSNDGVIDGNGAISFPAGNPTLRGTILLPITVTNTEVKLNGYTTSGNINLAGGGKINLDNYDLTMNNANLSGFNNQNFIIASGNGKLVRTVGINDVIFPVGSDNLTYTPVTIGKLYSSRIGGRTDAATVNFQVNVRTGVQMTGSSVTKGVVNRTWTVNRADTGAFRLSASWNAGDELPGFDRNSSFLSLVCPPPYNPCVSGFDVVAPSVAVGTGPFTMSRVGSFDSTTASFSFTVRSSPVNFEFTGSVSSDWNNPLNWAGGVVGPLRIINGVEIFINENCSVNGTVLTEGGKLTVKAGKQLTIVQ